MTKIVTRKMVKLKLKMLTHKLMKVITILHHISLKITKIPMTKMQLKTNKTKMS